MSNNHTTATAPTLQLAQVGEESISRALADAAERLAAAQGAIASAHVNASILVGAASADLAGALALAGSAPGHVSPLLIVGGAALLVALVAAGGVIFPRLRTARSRCSGHALYFGELRHWDADALARHLATRATADRLGDYCEQVTTVSAIAWSKHCWYRVALVAASVGAVLALAAFLEAAS